MDIKCRKTSCKHNNKFRCDATTIGVTKEQNCSTYEKSTQSIDKSRNLFYGKIEYAPYRNAKNMQIDCHANCLFNREGECYANGICVNDVDMMAECMTFIKK